MTNNIMLFPADKPRFSMERVAYMGRRFEVRANANGFVLSVCEMTEQDVVNLRDLLTAFILSSQPQPPTFDTFADEEARRQEMAAGSYAGCDSNHNQQ